MQLTRELAVRALNLIRSCASLDTEHFVMVCHLSFPCLFFAEQPGQVARNCANRSHVVRIVHAEWPQHPESCHRSVRGAVAAGQNRNLPEPKLGVLSPNTRLHTAIRGAAALMGR